MASASAKIDRARRLGEAHRELERLLASGLNKTMNEPDPTYACLQRTMDELLLHRSLEPDRERRDLQKFLEVGVNASRGVPDPTLDYAKRIQVELLRCRAGLSQHLGRVEAGGDTGAKSLERADAIVQIACDAFAPLARLALELTLTPAISALAEVFNAAPHLAGEQCAAKVAKLFNLSLIHI